MGGKMHDYLLLERVGMTFFKDLPDLNRVTRVNSCKAE
jgi:hypothetical protein